MAALSPTLNRSEVDTLPSNLRGICEDTSRAPLGSFITRFRKGLKQPLWRNWPSEGDEYAIPRKACLNGRGRIHRYG